MLAGKSVVLLGVSGGQSGVLKTMEHLRSVCSHVGAIILPGPVRVARVQHHFENAVRYLDESLESCIRRLKNYLVAYIRDSICLRAALDFFVL